MLKLRVLPQIPLLLWRCRVFALSSLFHHTHKISKMVALHPMRNRIPHPSPFDHFVGDATSQLFVSLLPLLVDKLRITAIHHQSSRNNPKGACRGKTYPTAIQTVVMLERGIKVSNKPKFIVEVGEDIIVASLKVEKLVVVEANVH